MAGPAPSVAEVRSAVRTCLASVRDGAGRDATTPGGRRGPGTVLVACSGGADSLALAAATAFEAPRAGLRAGLITVDHGLSVGSAGRARHVADLARGLGLDPVVVTAVTVGSTGGPEAAAREARYTALAAAAEQHDAAVLLGHTLDDQAETVLLGLGRGSGPRSIVGMAAVDGPWLRPLLGVRRATTVAACAALGLDPWHDPHNIDAAFQRVRVRHEVLPLLEDVLQGGVAEALARTADLLRDDLAALDAWARHVVPVSSASPATAPGQLEVGVLDGLPRAVRTRVLRAWAATHTAEPLSAERTAALDGLISDWHGQGPVQLPGRVAVRRTSGRLVAHLDP